MLVINQWSGYGSIPCGSSNGTRCIPNGDAVIEVLSFSEVSIFYTSIKAIRFLKTSLFKSNWGTNLGALGALLVGWRVLTFIVLLFKSYRR